MLRRLKRIVGWFKRRSGTPLCEKVSLIVPTYNVEPYIGDFLNSVRAQTTGFRNLEVIIVDDGSTDRSGEIAQEWARRFPDTFLYIRQDNQGPAAARNTGLEHATGDWVSFPDPDDMLPPDWLHAFNLELKRRHKQPLLIVSRPLHFFREKSGKISRNHPLASLYRRRTTTATEDMGDFITLSTATNFIRRSKIEWHGLRFDQRVRPSFEDGHFMSRLLSVSSGYSIVRLPSPAYIYRKRAAGTSLLDGAKANANWLTGQMRFGYLDVLNSASGMKGKTPRFIQRTVLYSMGWRFRYLLNHPERASHLTDKERTEFLTLLDAIFTFIEPDTIRTMNLGGLHEEYKTGLLAMFKGESRANDIVYVKQYDAREEMMQFSFYAGEGMEPDVDIFVDGRLAEKKHPNRAASRFLDRTFFVEHFFWVHASERSRVRVTIDGRPAHIKHGWRMPGDVYPARRIIKKLRPQPSVLRKLPTEARALRAYATSAASRLRFAGCWVLMDRDDAADDNAEHLYRHLMRTGRAEKAFFILRPESPDWPRLAQEGFRLLAFGGKEHIAALVNADILASSHADHFILWPVAKEWIQDIAHYRYVFLRHGISMTDMSLALNRKPIQLMVSSSEAELRSIASLESNYVFSDKETKLTGLPRHDALLSRERSADTILVMPTWRRYLVGERLGIGAEATLQDDFMASIYARRWKEFLHSDGLKTLAEKHGKTITFCPHPNMAMYLKEFDLPGYIRCFDARKPPSLQERFAEAAVLVTDYSSVSFECAYIDKPVVYYQFDSEKFFGGEHTYTKGHFDDHRDGFGPVSETLEQTLAAVAEALEGRADADYARRREAFFAFRDGQCCERVYRAICEVTGDPEKSVAAGNRVSRASAL